MLEDNQVSLSTMKASRYVKAFEVEVKSRGEIQILSTGGLSDFDLRIKTRQEVQKYCMIFISVYLCVLFTKLLENE